VAVDQLERNGLVERRVFEGDKRGYLATLTAEGRGRCFEERRAFTSKVFGNISCPTSATPSSRGW
jgi:DNA-binding MarR family transcriptional regulator